MTGRPRRFITQSIVFLLLGAIVSVVVAWGCCVRYSPGVDLPYSATESDRQWWARRRPEGFSDGPFGKASREAFGWRSIELYDIDRNPTLSTIHCPRVVLIRGGWPALGLEGYRWLDTNKKVVEERRFISLDWIADEPRVFPCDPIWPGIAINTTFYAAILWLLFAAPFALRRRSRIKRSLCPACTYPIGASHVCTECGAALRWQGST